MSLLYPPSKILCIINIIGIFISCLADNLILFWNGSLLAKLPKSGVIFSKFSMYLIFTVFQWALRIFDTSLLSTYNLLKMFSINFDYLQDSSNYIPKITPVVDRIHGRYFAVLVNPWKMKILKLNVSRKFQITCIHVNLTTKYWAKTCDSNL